MKKLQVLLAEDNAGDVFLVQEALRSHSVEHDLRLLKDGAEASRYLQRMGITPDIPFPDVFLVDLNLPSGDGHELVRIFRSHPECANVPVVVLTSSDATRDRVRAQELGVNAYFRKPSNLTDFLVLGEVVTQVVGMAGTAR